jgi:predicted DNA-binding transcriptional regulator AlpA
MTLLIQRGAATALRLPNDELLDLKTTCAFFGGTRPINPATLYRGIKKGRYPAPIHVGPGTSRWLRAECQATLDAMIARRAEQRS